MTDAVGVAVDRKSWRRFLEQPLDFDLSFSGAGNRSPEMEDGFLDWREPLDARTDQHEGRASKNAIHQKEIAETVGVKSLNSPSLHDWHSNVLPSNGRTGLQGTTCNVACRLQSDKSDSSYSYGWSSSSILNEGTQTGGFARAGCVCARQDEWSSH